LSPDLKRGRIIVSLYLEGYLPETIEKLKIIDKGIDIVSTVFCQVICKIRSIFWNLAKKI
jgi:hypothetical protein